MILLKRTWSNLTKKSIIFMLFGALLIIVSSSAEVYAQPGNMYEEPWHPASRFAVKEASKKEKATITLVKVKDANFTTGEPGLDFNMCLEVKVKKGRKKAVTQFVQTNVFRDDKTMAYILKSWVVKKEPECGN